VCVADPGFLPVATRQTSSSGKSKSPRIQVVLPEGLWERLSAAAAADSRTVSNMAKVLIQQGLSLWENQEGNPLLPKTNSGQLRRQLEHQQQSPVRRLRGRPTRFRLRGGP
jgi:hypothetical protein